MIDKKKVQKTLNKKCPDCDGQLEIIVCDKNNNGVIYSENYEECSDCGYRKKVNNRKNKVERYEPPDII
jgi:C4-type Zn-finger protein